MGRRTSSCPQARDHRPALRPHSGEIPLALPSLMNSQRAQARARSSTQPRPASPSQPEVRSHSRSVAPSFSSGIALASRGELRSDSFVLELDLKVTADQALAECRERGLVVQSERALAARPGSHHWHLRIPGRTGTLELNEWETRVWVKVHPMRDGGWATALAHELTALPESESSRRSR